MGAGADLIRQFSAWIKEKGIEVLLEHEVQRILMNEKGEATGIEAAGRTAVFAASGEKGGHLRLRRIHP
ncbi:hypothetical protein MASR1M66_04190 [Aminivibrio sp.]